ncbi:hypothetical protein BDV12DRAFT_202847 [Aspergillus spectabilis]
MGIAGLAAAVECHRSGHSVIALERINDQMPAGGDLIGIASNAARVLAKWDNGDMHMFLTNLSSEITTNTVYKSTGQRVFEPGHAGIREPAIAFPNDAIFQALVHAAKTSNKCNLSDPDLGIEADYSQFLGDVLRLVGEIQQSISTVSNYAPTEMSVALGWWGEDSRREEVDARIIGKPLPGVSVRLSDGDRGEIQIKSPLLFKQYLGDPQATVAAFDEDGENYVIDGRVSLNVIRVFAHRVLTMEALMALPYISEAYVLGVPDALVGSRTAALIRIQGSSTVTLDTLRKDLQGSLKTYKLPALLRTLTATKQVPKTTRGKFDLGAAREVFFLQSQEGSVEPGILPDDVEVLD